MSTEKLDPRTTAVLNGVHKTSLSEFMSKVASEPVDNGKDITDTTDYGDDAKPKTETKESTEDDTDAKTTEETADGDKASEDSEYDKAIKKGKADDVYEVAGKKLTLKELMENYETRENIQRRFTEVDVKEKKLKTREDEVRAAKAELAVINEKFVEMQEAVLAGNPLEALHIAMLMAQENSEDADNAATVKMLVQQAEKVAENYHNMTEAEREVAFEKERLKLKEKKLNKQAKKTEIQEKNTKIEQHFNNVLNTHNVTDAEMDAVYDEIQTLPKFKEELDKKDEIGKINYCASWVLGKRFRQTVEQGIMTVNPEAVKDDKLVLALINLCDPRYDKDQVAKVYKDYLVLENKNSAESKSEAPKQDTASKTVTPDRIPTEKPKAEKEDKPTVITSFKDLIAKHSSN